MQRWTCVAVSTYPAHGPGRVNGAGAGLLWRAFCFPPPPMSHQKRLGSVLLQPLGSSTSILTRRPAIAHRPPLPLNSFRDFRNPPRPLREASSLRAASPRPGSKSPPGARLDREGRRRAELVETFCPNCDRTPTPNKSSANRASKRGWWRIRTAPCGLSQTRGAKPREGVERASGGPPVKGKSDRGSGRKRLRKEPSPNPPPTKPSPGSWVHLPFSPKINRAAARGRHGPGPPGRGRCPRS